MRQIDADELVKHVMEAYTPEECATKCAFPDDFITRIDSMPTVDPWHYSSEGEDIYNANLDWGITYFLCQMKDGKLAIAFGSCDEDCEGNVSRNINFCGENFDVLDTDNIYAWQYIEPPKEEVNG